MDHGRYQESIERLFTNGLSAEKQAELRQHIKGCNSCEQTYERFAKAERALFNNAPALTPFAAERVLGRLLPEKKPRREHRAWIYSVGGVMAAAAAILVIARGPTEAPSEFTTHNNEVVAPQLQVTLRALRVRVDASGSAEVADVGAGGKLSPGDNLKLLYSNLGEAATLKVEAITADGARHVLIKPFDMMAQSEDRSAGDAFIVPDTWPAGPVKIVGTFQRGATTETREIEALVTGAPEE